MKNIFLTVVVVCALVVVGIGGTLAGFSDTERSLNNKFEVGNLDLKVSGNSGVEYDDVGVLGIPVKIVDATLVWPCISKDFTFDVHNAGDNTETSYAYMMFKDITCYEVYTAKFPTPNRPEPENVAENGGVLANVWTAGLGPWGQNCTLKDFIEVVVWIDKNGDGDVADAGEQILGTQVWGGTGTVYLSALAGKWIALGELPGCNLRVGKMSMHISNWSEEEWSAGHATVNYFANDLPFNDWLTNLFMNDGVNFTLEWALAAEPIPASYQYIP
jgi:predicted ribosomally synthesized peptide with SipW-like signal peptide